MNEKERTVTMYVTKWWATKGIVRLNGHVVHSEIAGVSYFSTGAGVESVFVRIGSQAFYGLDQAHDYVMKKAKKKHASLLKQAAVMANAMKNSVDVVYSL